MLSLLVIGLGLFFNTFPAQAHKVNVFAYSEGNTIFTESYFPDGRKVQRGKIEVYDSTGAKLLEGTTDDKGVFNFPTPKKDDLKIILIATMGHKNSFLIKAEEIEAVAEETKIATEASIPKQEVTQKEAGKVAVQPSKASPPKTHQPPKESHVISALIGLGVIFGLTYLIMRFAKKDKQDKSRT
jgi:nickel transport protein